MKVDEWIKASLSRELGWKWRTVKEWMKCCWPAMSLERRGEEGWKRWTAATGGWLYVFISDHIGGILTHEEPHSKLHGYFIGGFRCMRPSPTRRDGLRRSGPTHIFLNETSKRCFRLKVVDPADTRSPSLASINDAILQDPVTLVDHSWIYYYLRKD